MDTQVDDVVDEVLSEVSNDHDEENNVPPNTNETNQYNSENGLKNGENEGETNMTGTNTDNHKSPSEEPLQPQTLQTDIPVYIEWKNLEYRVQDREDKKKTKVILKGLNGHACPGELVAIIGPSGSGKSSFLNCLSNRNQIGVTGDILYNRIPRPKNSARFTGYVTQDDVYFESLTVRETLTFAAGLKLPRTVSKEDKKARVDYVINQLDLGRCENTQVGQVGKGISGGERRRLAIALEILNEPSLLLLDEPTSGLDSASALMVGKILKKLCRTKSLTIIATIHQPRYALATLFDKLYFLAQGQEIYFGPTIPKCLGFFEQAGFPCPEYDNPADFLLDLVNTSESGTVDKPEVKELRINTEEPEDDEEEKFEYEDRQIIIDKLVMAYQESEYRQKASVYDLPEKYHGDKVFSKVDENFYITSIWNQMWIVFARSWLHKFREPIAMMTQAFNSIFVPLLFGSVYWQIDNSQSAAFDRISATSLILLMASFFAFDVLVLFPSERTIFNREQSSGMYRPISFYVGRTLSEAPQHILFAFIMATISYWMYGFQNDGAKYLTWVAIVELEISAGAGLLYLFGSLSKDMEQSNLLATVFILLFMLFDGNWISLKEIPVMWSWVPHVSYIAYAGAAGICNEYRGLEFKCSNNEVDSGECFYTSGSDVIYQRGLEDTDIFFNCMMLVVLNFIYRFLAFLGVWLCFRPHPPKYIIQQTCCPKKNNKNEE